MNDAVVEVKLWGTTIGYLGYLREGSPYASFSFSPEFMDSSISIAPLSMDNSSGNGLFEFNDISFRTFKGLPGIFADSLPDKFGNQLIDQFMESEFPARPKESITSLDRLLYVADRGMGAIEYHPFKLKNKQVKNITLDINSLARLADLVLSRGSKLKEDLNNAKTREDALGLIRVGGSAGGARAKALIAEKEDGKFYDGTQLYHEPCTYWLLKFDSSNNSDRDSGDPKGMTRVEYIYSILARECGINMPRTKYLEFKDDFHFMIERFDRVYRDGKSDKLHYASWSGLTHSDRDTTGAYSYEQLVMTARRLELGQDAVTEIFRRAIFNIVGRNQDDHTKNFGFIMNREGEWSLSPAFDMTYSYDPTGIWTQAHQIKLNGKQDNFTIEDILDFGRYCNIAKEKAEVILSNTQKSFEKFENLARKYKVNNELVDTILKSLKMRNGRLSGSPKQTSRRKRRASRSPAP